MKACSFKRKDGKDVYGYVIFGTASNPFFHWTQWLSMWNWGADTLKWDEAKQQWLCALTDDTGVTWLKFMQDLYFATTLPRIRLGLTAHKRRIIGTRIRMRTRQDRLLAVHDSRAQPSTLTHWS